MVKALVPRQVIDLPGPPLFRGEPQSCSISILRAERILSWRHAGFNVHSLVRAKTKPEAKRVKGRAFGSPLARDLYPRASTAEVDPRAKPGVPAAVGKYMIRPLLALERLSFLEPEGKVGYHWGLIWNSSPG